MILEGCSIDTSRVAPGYIEAFRSINYVIFGYPETDISAEQIEKIPYASLVLQIGKGPKGLMILESRNSKDNIWVSADSVYLKERDGKIIQTIGLSNNIDELEHTINFSELKKVDTSKTYIYYKSFSSPELDNLRIEATFNIKDRRLVKLLNRSINLTLVEETITSEELGWKAVNQYWIDDSSYIWKSSQKISPKLPRISIEVTKKPS